MDRKQIRNLRSKIAILAVQNPKNTRKTGFGASTIRTYVNYESEFSRLLARLCRVSDEPMRQFGEVSDSHQ